MDIDLKGTTTDRDGGKWLPEIDGRAYKDAPRDFDRPGAGNAMRLLVRESRTNNAFDPLKFRTRLRAMLGLVESVGKDGGIQVRFDPRKKQLDYDEMPFGEVTRELWGAEFWAALRNPRTASHANSQMVRSLREAAAPITASAQQDVNAYSIYTGGLIEMKFHEGYDLPEFIAGKLFPSEPTQTNANRIIGEANMALPDRATGEGIEYPNQQVIPRWIFAPPRVKYGQKAALTREAVAFQLGGILMQQIQKGGMALGYLKEYLSAATAWGQNIAVGTPGFMAGYTVNTFAYDGQPNAGFNNTYQTAVPSSTSVYNYVNKFTGGTGLNSWTDLQTARGNLSLMREPETAFPIMARLKEVIVQPFTHDTALQVRHATGNLPAYGGGLAGGQPIVSGAIEAPQLAENSNLLVWASPIWQKVLLDAGVSQTNSNYYWLAGDLSKAFKWLSVWDARIIQANELSSSLVERDIVGEWVYSWYGVPVVFDPHYVLLQTN